jgi:flagellar protein FlaJ
MKEINFQELRESLSKQKIIIKEINSMYESNKTKDNLFSIHIKELIERLKKECKKIEEILSKLNLPKELEEKIIEKVDKKNIFEVPLKFSAQKNYSWRDMKPDKMEKETFKRFKKEKKLEEEIKPTREASNYVKWANKLFSKYSKKFLDDKTFSVIEKNLSQSNIQFTGQEYVSTILLTAIISIGVALVLILFFLFFNISPEFPIISRTSEQIGSRFLKLFWLLFVMPVATMLIMFSYPSMEKRSKEIRIDQEIPFATLNMSAIAGSLIDPTDIFKIIISTNEYPKLSEQFIKLINETNIYGYDLVSVLRNSADNSPSKKLAELYSGLLITVTSGGDLAEFFDKRAETLLFEYRLEKEKKTKGAETFMDIYISMVIAAPMILMILLMMMKMSGLGVALSTQTITLIMVITVTVINLIFISFLEVKK